ncbi:MAG: class I SAM-dependent methyltransferase [Bacillota bacterium]
MTDYKICPITEKPMKPAFSEKILRKYNVTYYFSEESGMLQTETPYWLDEAYQSAISCQDTGVVRRNISNSKILEPALCIFCNPNARFLDIGGGYGLLTRLMRDIGFDFYTLDPYCENLFAKTFEPTDEFKAEALTAFEVLEHIENPKVFLETYFKKYHTRTILFSTLTFKEPIPDRNWWYYSFESGQHISFYQPKTLDLLAKIFGCKYYMISPEFHVITDKNISPFKYLIMRNRHSFTIYSAYIRYIRKNLSKTWEDHAAMKSKQN